MEPEFTKEQVMWLEDLLTNQLEMRCAKMRYAYGISQCGNCLEAIKGVISKIRSRKDGIQHHESG